MKIHLNEVFNTYEVTECDRKFGNEITLDGESLISLDKVKQAVEEIEKHSFPESVYGFGYGKDKVVSMDLVWEILDNLAESEG